MGVGHSSTRYFSTGGGLGHDSAGLTRLMQDSRLARRSDEGLRGAFKEKNEARLLTHVGSGFRPAERGAASHSGARVFKRDGGSSFVLLCVPQQTRELRKV